MDMFAQASYAKIRFTSSKGDLSTEDLWSLSLSTLDTMAKGVYRLLLAEQEESFVPTPITRKPTHNQLRLDILKYIIAWRVEKERKQKIRAEAQERIRKLKDLMLQKQDETWAAQSMEELQKQITALELQITE